MYEYMNKCSYVKRLSRPSEAENNEGALDHSFCNPIGFQIAPASALLSIDYGDAT
jgi:hypothetical protein